MWAFTQLIEAAKPARGIVPSFTPYHALLLLLTLYSEGPTGRPTLIKRLRIGEAGVRTLVKRLARVGLVTVDRVAGVILTDNGRKVVEDILKHLRLIDKAPTSGLCSDCEVSGVIICSRHDILRNLRNVLQIRDAVVREGGTGALIIVKVKNEIYLPVPGGLEPVRDIPLANILRDSMNDGDIALIAMCSKDDMKCLQYSTNVAINILAGNAP